MAGIRIENLTFTYEKAKAPTLTDINLSIERGAIALIIGESGSGKTTLLNIIAEKLNINRVALYNCTAKFNDYVEMCDYSLENEIPRNSMMITSDDVFNYILNMRAVNQNINFARNELFKEYDRIKKTDRKDLLRIDFGDKKSVAAFDRNMAILKKSRSRFVKENLVSNVREYSNGENALRYFQEKIDENTLYLLDEPENSLSSKMQIKLAEYIEASARGCGCQFIIATHSPFLLAMPDTKIYNLNADPVAPAPWYELDNMRQYFELFDSFSEKFKAERKE